MGGDGREAEGDGGESRAAECKALAAGLIEAIGREDGGEAALAAFGAWIEGQGRERAGDGEQGSWAAQAAKGPVRDALLGADPAKLAALAPMLIGRARAGQGAARLLASAVERAFWRVSAAAKSGGPMELEFAQAREGAGQAVAMLAPILAIRLGQIPPMGSQASDEEAVESHNEALALVDAGRSFAHSAAAARAAGAPDPLEGAFDRMAAEPLPDAALHWLSALSGAMRHLKPSAERWLARRAVFEERERLCEATQEAQGGRRPGL